MTTMDELDTFKRDINLVEYACAHGYEIDRHESSRSLVVLRNPDADKLVVSRRSAEGHWTYFSVRDDQDNGTIIDFIQRRVTSNLGQIRKDLRTWLGRDRPRPTENTAPSPVPVHRDLAHVRTVFNAAHVSTNSHYLNSRGIRPQTLADLRFRTAWREDNRRNVFFPHFDRTELVGFEIKNYGFTGFATGGCKALWRSHVTLLDTCAVFTESAIDALSFHQLNPNNHTRYYSTGGALSLHQRDVIAYELTQLPPEATAVSAFDHDDPGEAFHCELEKLVASCRRSLHRVTPPSGKDWNDYLQSHECDYIRSLAHTHPTSPRELDH